MTWFAIYQAEDGRLVSGTNDAAKVASADIIAARGYAVKQFADGSQNGVWNPATLSYDPAPAGPNVIDTGDFFDRFTAAELRGILQSTDATVQQWLFVMQRRGQIDLTAQKMTAALQYLVIQGLLTAPRANAIRTP